MPQIGGRRTSADFAAVPLREKTAIRRFHRLTQILKSWELKRSEGKKGFFKSV
jgi:hypothetical protein